MTSNVIRNASIALTLGSLLMAGQASAIMHDELPGMFQVKGVKLVVPSVLLRSDQLQTPESLRDVVEQRETIDADDAGIPAAIG